MMSGNNVFTDPKLSESYRKFRPAYPDELHRTAMDYLREKLPAEGVSQAVDVGCGSGQNTERLAVYFDQVLGVDISQAQIDQANKYNTHTNLQYRRGNFDNLFQPANSVDLVTCASAAHWFEPIEDFYTEVDRVLKPNGVLAISFHMPLSIDCFGYDGHQLTECFEDFCRDDRQEHLTEILNKERCFKLPYEGWQRIETIRYSQNRPFDQFLGYLKTWSCYVAYIQQNPQKSDPLDELIDRYQKILGDLKGVELSITWEMWLLIGRKPK